MSVLSGVKYWLPHILLCQYLIEALQYTDTLKILAFK